LDRTTRTAEILLVEDNPDDVALTREAFAESPFAVTLHVANDGIHGLEMLRNGGVKPDLILMDLNLPKISGRDVLHEIKSDDALRHIPIIVLTTSQADQDILDSYRLYASCYVAKPVDFDDFMEVVRAI